MLVTCFYKFGKRGGIHAISSPDYKSIGCNKPRTISMLRKTRFRQFLGQLVIHTSCLARGIKARRLLVGVLPSFQRRARANQLARAPLSITSESPDPATEP